MKPHGDALVRCREANCSEREEATNTFKRCSGCGAKYCSRECQVRDWKAVHKLICKRKDTKPKCQKVGPGTSDDEVVLTVLDRVSIYTGPFVVHNYRKTGKGFLFLQSPNTLKDLRYVSTVDEKGKPLDRTLCFHFIPQSEYAELCKDVPMMKTLKKELLKNINAYTPEKEVVVVVRMACGYLKCFLLELVPDFKLCLSAAAENPSMCEQGMLQLNLDAS